MTKEEELQLFEDWNEARKNNDKIKEDRLFRKIITQYSPTVLKLVKKMGGYKLDVDDMISEATLALTKAAIDFDPSLGFRFGTYAISCIRNNLFSYVSQNYFLTNVCSNRDNKKAFFRLRKIMYDTMSKGGTTTLTHDVVQDLATQIGVSTETVETMVVILRNPYSSLNEPMNESDDLSTETWLDQLVSDDPTTEENIEEKQTAILRSEVLNNALMQLDDRTRFIIQEQLLRPDETRATLEELGDKFKVSKERIRQLREAGLTQISKHIKNELNDKKIALQELLG